jgi:serine phosphatase RsbU (regulator of sigma subunit)/anti-sigma regulatory factor (Ser/Thr protein kinase)
MAARMREFDWASSPLGRPEDWPPSLTTAVRICLTSRFPMIVWWGPDLRFLYNDAYLPLLGTKHPVLDKPGEQVWGDIWHIVGPMLHGVLATGEATWSEDVLLPMNRYGYWEETYWTYSSSPVHDDSGAVRAVFTAVTDTTERVIGERRLAALRELGARAGIARTVDEACRLVADVLGRAGADVPYAAIHVRRPGTDDLVLAAVTPGGSGNEEGWPLREVLADGVPRTVSGLTAKFGELPSGGWSTPPVEAVVLPLPGDAGGPAIGVIVLAASAGHAVDESYRTFLGLVAQQTAALVNGAGPLGTEDRALLALLSGTLAHALRRAHRDDRQREVALALQRSILGPARLPEGFAVRYEPANPPLEVGGDWYDVIPLDGDRIGIVVGDCVGRGLAAAAVMGQLRSACRALLLEANSPSHTLTALDRFAVQVPDALCTTVFCGVLDPATGTLTYSSAGHPPATLVHRDGTAEFLDAGGSVPLAVRVPEARPEATAVVPVGSLLMLYTDGLVERRHESLDDGVDRATGVAHDAHDAELSDLASTLMSSLRPDDGYEDDVALLLYRRTVPPLTMEFEANPESLAATRHWLRAWLTDAGLDEDLEQDVLVAAGEACANAVEHAYPAGAGPNAHLSVRLTGAHLVVTIADHGRWKQPPPDNHVLRGRGMPMMEALADAVTVRHDTEGTTVTLEWRVGS